MNIIISDHKKYIYYTLNLQNIKTKKCKIGNSI